MSALNSSHKNVTTIGEEKVGDLIGGCFLLAMLFGIIIFLICSCIRFTFLTIQARKTKPRTEEPFVPEWLGPTAPKRFRKYLKRGVRVETRPFDKKWTYDRGRSFEKDQEAVKWIQDIMYDVYDAIEDKVYVPDDACLIQVPMKNFKCGRTCTDFEPTNGTAPESHFTYQVCGKERIQITRYVEDGVSYVAGFCVYIKDAYDSSIYYSTKHLKMCYRKRQKYVPKSVSPQPPAQTTTQNFENSAPNLMSLLSSPISETVILIEDFPPEESINQPDARETSKTLRGNFCEILENPVFLGLDDDGVVKHFKWLDYKKRFTTTNCPSCKEVEWGEEEPPAYHSLVLE